MLSVFSIHDSSPASTGDTDVVETKFWACLWRSILMSCVGQSSFPYCLWIRALNLGNLHSLLEDLARDRFRVGDIDVNYKVLRQWFFSTPLRDFYITRKRARTVMDLDQIVIKAGDAVTSFIKQAAEDENKTVMLSSLEGYHLPTTCLQDWVSRLSHLSSLTVRDGSVLTADVARMIRANCPLFKEVVCHYCIGTDVDQDLAGFISGLVPNTLESFTIMSVNAIGEQTFRAMTSHSVSLRVLRFCVELPGLTALHFLSGCSNLKEITIEASGITARGFHWERELKDEFQQVVSWLAGCLSLTSLDLVFVPNASSILHRILRVPEIRLVSLDVKLVHASEHFYSSLGQQTDLESLVIRSDDELVDLVEPASRRHQNFIDSICSCTRLRKLDLMNELLSKDDILRIVESLPLLDDLAFDGDFIGNDFLLPLAGLRLLKTLNINALSYFTFTGILKFISDLRFDEKASHDGLRIYIMRQFGDHKLSDAEERMLTDEVARRFKGRFEITYEGDPDELHESDFSD